MKLKALIDEDLPRSIADVFRSLGFAVFDVRDVGLKGKSDLSVFNWAQEKKAIIVSADLGFANEIEFSKHKGMIILHFPNELSTVVVNQEALRLLKDFKEKDFKNNLVIVSPGHVRIRKPILRENK